MLNYIFSFLFLYLFIFLLSNGIFTTNSSLVKKWNTNYSMSFTTDISIPGTYFINDCSKLNYNYLEQRTCIDQYKSGVLIYSFINKVPNDNHYNKCFIVFNYSKSYKKYGGDYLKLLILREIGYCLGISNIEEQDSIMQKNIPYKFKWNNELKDKAILQQILDEKKNGFIQTDYDDNPIFPLNEIQNFYFLL